MRLESLCIPVFLLLDEDEKNSINYNYATSPKRLSNCDNSNNDFNPGYMEVEPSMLWADNNEILLTTDQEEVFNNSVEVQNVVENTDGDILPV